MLRRSASPERRLIFHAKPAAVEAVTPDYAGRLRDFLKSRDAHLHRLAA